MFIDKQTIFYFLFLLLSISLLPSFNSMGIHILLVKRLTKKEVQHTPVPTLNSKYSKMCLSVSKTFNDLGKDSLNMYKLCDGKFNLLGKSSELIKDKCPLCFRGLDQFYCNNKFENNENQPNTSNSNCKNDELTRLVLSTIEGCLEVS